MWFKVELQLISRKQLPCAVTTQQRSISTFLKQMKQILWKRWVSMQSLVVKLILVSQPSKAGTFWSFSWYALVQPNPQWLDNHKFYFHDEKTLLIHYIWWWEKHMKTWWIFYLFWVIGFIVRRNIMDENITQIHLHNKCSHRNKSHNWMETVVLCVHFTNDCFLNVGKLLKLNDGAKKTNK